MQICAVPHQLIALLRGGGSFSVQNADAAPAFGDCDSQVERLGGTSEAVLSDRKTVNAFVRVPE